MKLSLALPIIPVLVMLWVALIPSDSLGLFFWALILLLPFIALSAFAIFAGLKRGFARLAIGVVLLLVFIAGSIVVTQWPLRLAFQLTEHQFNDVSSDLKRGQSFPKPFRIGPFKFEKAEINRHGLVCLWTDSSSGDLDGFVQTTPDVLPFNLWSTISLSDEWQYIVED
jgi:hypothetical protein